jgi:type IV pilus assembly protein PilB
MEPHAQKLGEILIKEKLITTEQLERALREQKIKKQPLGEVLVQLGFANERDILIALSKQLNIPLISLQTDILLTQITEELKALVPEKFARDNLVLPLSKDDNLITVALDDPLDFETIDNLKKITKCEIQPVMAVISEIKEAIDTIYGKKALLDQAISATYSNTEGLALEIRAEKEELGLDQLIASAEEAPVVKLVDLIINEAIESRATDIHVEPFAKYVRIRYRIDGILYEISPPAKHLYLAIVSRIKILSKLDIAEKRMPQDGSFGVKKGTRLVDIRVSTIPTVYGEKIVMRILDRSMTPLQLEQLGFTKEEQAIFEKYINMRMGLILLTGPTGSGKTTTLYAAINRIKSPELNILTVEDPVEYHLDGINQMEVKPKIGLTFATGLRAFLRQDPDIIMVGEVRDLETAQICIRASLTGHLVFSTIHTNDTASAVTRLIDIGVEPYLVTSSLIMAVAQRLMRRLCPNCKEAYAPQEEIAKELGIKASTIYKAKGCRKCRMTGYYGQVAIYEILTTNDEIKDLASKNSPPHMIKHAACKQGMRTLRESAINKVDEGITSIEEALRATMGIE